MNCDQCRQALVSGRPADRERAHVHLAACTACDRHAAQLASIVDSLRDSPPVSQRQRALWMAVADSARELPHGSQRSWHPHSWRIAAVLLVGLGLAITVWRTPGPRPQRNAPTSSRTSVVTTEFRRTATHQLNVLGARLDVMEHELAELERQADMLDERREAETLWASLRRADSSAQL